MKRLSVSLVVVVVLVGSAWLAGRYEEHAAISRANEILNGADALRVNRADFAEVAQYVRHYSGDERSSEPAGVCTPTDCLATVYAFAPSFISRHPNLVSWAGLRPFHVHVSLWVRNGTLTATEKVFFVPRAVGATVYVAVSISDPGPHMTEDPAYKLHNTYIASFREHHNTPKFRYWINAGNVAGAHPSSSMNLDCVLAMGGCGAPAQVLPAAWERYAQDQAR